MNARFSKLFFAWVALIVLLVLETAAAATRMPGAWRPGLLLFAVAMAFVIVHYFMELGHGPGIVRMFATAALIWLAILLALGSLDPFTRFTYLS